MIEIDSKQLSPNLKLGLGNNDGCQEPIKLFIAQNMAFFESAILLTLMYDFEFWQQVRSLINIPMGRMKFYDFTKPIDNEIYKTINSIYESFIGSSGSIGIGDSFKLSKELIIALIANKVNEPKSGIIENDLRAAEFRFQELELTCPKTVSEFESNIRIIVYSGFTYWLERRRVLQIASYTIKNSDKVDAPMLIDTIQSSLDIIGSQRKDPDEIQTFGEALEMGTSMDEDESNGRMPIPGLPILTKALGGGLKRGETGLIISASGGGKTVIALQIAAGMALSGYDTLVVTTEQHSKVLVNRIISCNANILFNKVKDGNLSTLTSSEKERLKEISTPLNQHLRFANWCKTGEMLETGLENEIKRQKEKGLDVLVIDWLGGGINLSGSEADKMHNYMIHCVNMIKNFAIKYNIFILVLAQANEKDAKSKQKLGRMDIDRCHTLDQPFTWALGISSLQGGANQRVNSPQESYLRKQYVNIWKGRMNGDLFYPILREFEYQRFVEKEMVEINNMPVRSVVTTAE